MGVILVEGYDEPNGRVLRFPSDDFAPPPRISTREVARMKIEEWRRKKTANRSGLRNGAKEPELPSPQAANSLILEGDMVGADSHMPESSIVCGIPEDQRLANRPVALANGIQRDSCAFTVPPTATTLVSTALWATEHDRQAKATMAEITPPLVSAEDRGKGDSTNATMHRLIGGKQ